MSSEPQASVDNRVWWRQLNKYHWYVFIISALGWLFDTMDGQIFLASRADTIRDLMPGATDSERQTVSGWVTSAFIVGWATGGLIFGVVGDKWGRAKTMALTIFIYALFTGLSGIAKTWEQFAAFRFLTGLGVGGEFAAGAALLSEVMPQGARAGALGMLQALSAVGNILGAVLYGLVTPIWGWQGLYFIGAFPALFAVFVRAGVKEPEKWVAAKEAAKNAEPGKAVQFGNMSEMFTDPKWRRHTLSGLALAVAGVIGLWGVGFWSPELIDSNHPQLADTLKGKTTALLAGYSPDAHASFVAGLDEKEKSEARNLLVRAYTAPEKKALGDKDLLEVPLTPERKTKVEKLVANSMPTSDKAALKSKALILQQVGGFFGMFFFGLIASRLGRRPTFLISFILAWISILVTFYAFNDKDQIWYLWPLLGFGTMAPFGGYALYFPELFPTRLRTSGTGFCYNVGRYFAALGPLILGKLSASFDGQYSLNGFRIAAMVVASSYIIGIVALIWAPETKDQPLPEDEKGFSH